MIDFSKPLIPWRPSDIDISDSSLLLGVFGNARDALLAKLLIAYFRDHGDKWTPTTVRDLKEFYPNYSFSRSHKDWLPPKMMLFSGPYPITGTRIKNDTLVSVAPTFIVQCYRASPAKKEGAK